MSRVRLPPPRPFFCPNGQKNMKPSGFASYRVSGASYFAAVPQNASYLDKSVWTKNLISRIIANPKYEGADGYPAIISQADFELANKRKSDMGGTQTELPEITVLIKSKLFCSCCGQNMGRRNKWLSLLHAPRRSPCEDAHHAPCCGHIGMDMVNAMWFRSPIFSPPGGCADVMSSVSVMSPKHCPSWVSSLLLR